MGLFIEAFSKAQLLHTRNNCDGGECLNDGHRVYAVNKHCIEDLDGYKPGCYMSGEGAKQFSFSVGTLEYYLDEWLGALALIIDSPPFHLLLGNFEPFAGLFKHDGAFGPKNSARLAKDFAEHAILVRTSMREHPENFRIPREETEYWLMIYMNFYKAFAVARKNGFIIFR